MTGKNLKAVLVSMFLASPTTIDCKIVEENLSAQYLMIEDSGVGVLRRHYTDISNPLAVKRCVIEYDVEQPISRGNKYLIIFRAPRYYNEQQSDIQADNK